ncbi:hypothetical protein [Nitrosococcus oceani]|nr:hypothetical protein [Nitrosococcus oceani]EDZ66172.1 hypothetical protein NOC27_2852 [Nitrosococcus oceani AFC27]
MGKRGWLAAVCWHPWTFYQLAILYPTPGVLLANVRRRVLVAGFN